MSTELWLPPGCQRLSDIKTLPQIRLGIQGAPGTGKTWAALTFPNCIVANSDRGLGAHVGRSDVVEIPFYDAEFCKKIDPNYTPSRKKDIYITWLEQYGGKLTSDQTLVWDGGTPTENAYHVWYEANKNKFLTREGKINEFAEWDKKLIFFGMLFDFLNSLRCHVVYIIHETEKQDKSGGFSGKIRPLLTGQMGNKIVGCFTDWFRQHSMAKPKLADVKDESLALWKMTRPEFQTMLNTFPGETIYFWQTQGDDYFDAKASSLVNSPRFIPASYESFVKYRRQISSSQVA